jgi:T5SS/PEP-CTERM-associated repeat protein
MRAHLTRPRPCSVNLIFLALVACVLDVGAHRAWSATISVSNTNDTGAGSLRQAILTANSSINVPDLINFTISGAGPHTISPATPLPTLTDPVTIDGYTQSGSSSNTLSAGDNAVLKIVVREKLLIDTTNCIVRGLAVRQIQLGAAPGATGGHLIEGCFVGLDADGTNTLGSTGAGVFIQSPGNRVGSPNPGARNVISGHGATGMEIFEAFATNNVVQGNYFGTDRNGTTAIPNTDRCVVVNMNASSNTIGGAVAGAGNLISGNLNRGITLDGANNVVQGNFIGTDVTGINPLGNARTGVEIGGPNNRVGGTNSGAGNVIAFNGVDGGGIFTTNGVDLKAGATGSTIFGNSIFDNLGLGIDVNADGLVTAGFPVLTSASNAISATIIRGTYTPNTTFRLELFTNPSPDPSGYGEGKNLLVSTNITTDAGGNFTINYPVALQPGLYLAATANGASEFSQDRIVTAAGGPNSWTNSVSGKWEVPSNWSLGAAPYIGHSLILVTNGGTKTVTCDSTTAGSFPTTLTISNLLVSAPAGGTNTVLLSQGTTTPLTILSNLTLNSGGALTIQNSALRHNGPSGTGLRFDGNATLAGGTLIATNNSVQTYIGNNSRGSLTVSAGTLSANYVVVGGSSGSDGSWNISGGTNVISGGAFDMADSLTATGTVSVTGGRLEVPNAYVGLFGNGRLFVSNGVVACAGTVLIGSQPGSQGTFIAAGGSSTFGGMQIRESTSAAGSMLVTSPATVRVDGNVDNSGSITVAGGDFSVGSDVTSEVAGNSILVSGGRFAATNGSSFLTSVTVSNGTFLARDVFLGNQKTGVFGVAGGVVALPGSFNGFNVGGNGGTGTLWQAGGQLLLTNTDLNVGGLFSPATGLLTISNGVTSALKMYVGGQGGGTGAVTVAGGTLITSNAFLGYDPALSSNIAYVTGTGSVWSNVGDMFLGYSGPGNRLVVSNGGFVRSLNAEVGHSSSSTSNVAILSGTNATWLIVSTFYFGSASGGNRLFVTNGAHMQDDNVLMGYFGGTNEAVVAGPGSTWTNTSGIYVGRFRGGNRLVLTNGGFIFSRGMYMGVDPSATNNRVLVDGGTILVTNFNGAGEMDLQRGTNTFNAGLIDVVQLWLRNSLAYFEFNGGTLRAGGTTNGNGRVFTVGNGTSTATFQMLGGTHVFSNNLAIARNGFLTGNGTVIGGVTNSGALAPGTSAGLINIVGPLVLSNSSDLRFEVGGYTPGTQHDSLSVTGSVTLGGKLSVTLIDGFQSVMTNGASFTLLRATNNLAGAFTNVASGGTLITTDGYARFTVQYAGANTVTLTGLAMVDTDNDGLPDWWEDQFGLNKNSSADANLDLDGDGASNLAEFRAGTQPNNANSVFRITSIQREANDVRISWSTVGGKSYRVQTNSISTGQGITTNFGDFSSLITVPGTNESTTNILHTGAATTQPGGYYRVRLEP